MRFGVKCLVLLVASGTVVLAVACGDSGGVDDSATPSLTPASSS